MRLRGTRSAAVAVGIALALGAFAQDPPPSQPPGRAEPEPPKLTKPVLDLEIELSFSGESGEGHALRRYSIPRSGPVLRRLELRPPLVPHLRASLLASYASTDDLRTEARLVVAGNAEFAASDSRFRSRNADPAVVLGNRRGGSEFSARYLVAPGVSAGLTYRVDQADLHVSDPTLRRQTDSNLLSVSMQGEIGQGHFNVEFADWRYRNRALAGSGADTARLSGGLFLPVGRHVDLRIAASRSRIDPETGEDGSARFDSASVSWRVGPATTLFAQSRREEHDFPTTRTVVAREKRRNGVEVSHRLPGWNLTASFSETEVERFRRDRNIVEQPQWRTFETKAVGRLPGDFRAVLRYRFQDISGRPESILSDPRTPYRSGRSSLEARIEGQIGTLSAYADVHAARIRNRGRGVDIETVGTVFGAFAQVGDRLEVFAEAAIETVAADSEVGPPRPLEAYWPGTRTVSLGANWRVDSRTSLSATFSTFRTDGDNPLSEPQGNTRGRTLTLSIRRLDAAGSALTLSYAPAAYRDELFREWNSRLSVWRLTYGKAF